MHKILIALGAIGLFLGGAAALGYLESRAVSKAAIVNCMVINRNDAGIATLRCENDFVGYGAFGDMWRNARAGDVFECMKYRSLINRIFFDETGESFNFCHRAA